MNLQEKKGVAFIIVLVFILLLTIAGGSFILISTSEIKMVRKQNNSTKAFYLAEAGIEDARTQLKEDWNNRSSSENILLGEGTYSFDIYNISTTIDASANTGNTTISVADTTGFSVGDHVLIDEGTSQEEEGKISSIDELSSSITLESGLSSDHDAGASIDRILSDKLRVKSTGNVDGASRIVEVIVQWSTSFGNPGGVVSAIEAEGTIEPSPNVTITGDTRETVSTVTDTSAVVDDTTISVTDTTGFNVGDHVLIDEGASQEEGKISSIDADNSSITLESGLSFDHSAGASVDRILSFEDIFGKSKAEMEALAVADHYYYPPEDTFSNDHAKGLTWISPAEGAESQITIVYQPCEGILIVDGDFKITGGVFNGVIWVIGELRVSGNPVINGGIFVECGVTVETTITGKAQISYNYEAVEDAFYEISSALPTIESWREVD